MFLLGISLTTALVNTICIGFTALFSTGLYPFDAFILYELNVGTKMDTTPWLYINLNT